MAEIKLKKLNKSFDDNSVVKDLDLTVEQGEIVALLGKSGCGKTTTLRMIAGLLDPDQGEISFDDETVTHLAGKERGAVMVFQDYRLFPHMTIFDNIAFGLKVRRKKKEYIRDKVAWAMEMVELIGYEGHYPAELSGGQRQRVALARALVLEPRVLLLDEPLSNLDAALRGRMRKLIVELHNKLNLTTIFVTHDQKEAMLVADRIAIMKDGIINQVASPTEIYYKPANIWVANFIGQSNLLSGKLKENKLETVLGDWNFSQLEDAHWANGDQKTREVRVLIRPEEITLSQVNGQVPLIRGQIEEYNFTGESWFYNIRAGDERILVRSSENKRFEKGELVDLKVNERSISIFAKEGVEC